MTSEMSESGKWVVDGIETYTLGIGGQLLAYGRAETDADLDAALLAEGLMVEVDNGDEGVEIRPLEHVGIDKFAYTITAAVTDEDGNVIEPSVVDPRPHFNLYIDLAEVDSEAVFATVLKWMQHGESIDPAEQNNAENGQRLGNITLLEPGTFQPARRFAL